MPVGISAGACGASTLGVPSEPEASANDTAADMNKNGVPDVAEKIADGFLTLSSSKKTAQYNESIPLTATLLDRDGATVIKGDSFSQVRFDVTKVVSLEGGKRTMVYDARRPGLTDTGVLASYVGFTPLQVRALE